MEEIEYLEEYEDLVLPGKICLYYYLPLWCPPL